MGENNQEWSWVGEDGTEHALDESELTFSLSSEELPAHVLVTKHGWGEWLPAMQVAELQWALPAGSADNPRKPSAGRKPKPPLERYPTLKQRARDILSGAVDPTAESSLAMPAVQLPLRPAPSSNTQNAPPLPAAVQGSPATVPPAQPAPPSAPTRSAPKQAVPTPLVSAPRPPSAPRLEAAVAAYRGFSMADAEEPTLQIDTEALDDAFERMQAAPVGPAPSAEADPAAASSQSPGGGRSAPELPPNLARPGSAYPPPVQAAITPASGSPATPGAPASIPAPSPSPAAARPVSSWPPRANLPSAPGVAAPAFNPPRPSSAPGPGASPVSWPAPEPHRPASKWPWIVAGLGIVGAAAAITVFGREPNAPLPSAPLPTPALPTSTAPVVASCGALVTPLPIAGWIYPNIRPVIARAPGADALAVGYAQTSRMAVGLLVDTRTLNVQKPFTSQGNSPLLSVIPATAAMGQQLSFLESRAASTLQSAIFVAAKRPFAFGQNRDGLAVRREGELQDVVVWKPQWETITVPSSARLDEKSHAIVIRAGGERGSLMLGKLSENTEPQGELQELIVDAQRIGLPTLTTSSGKALVAFDAVARDNTRKVYIAAGDLPGLPSMPEAVLSSNEAVSMPAALALRDGSLVLAYTRGAVGGQSIVAQVFDPKRKPVGPLLEISPPDKDAYHAELALDGDRVVLLYIVRQGNNNELWASSLSCKTAER